MNRTKLIKEKLEIYTPECYSFSEVCRKVGLSPVGANISRVKKKLIEYNIDFSHFTNQGWNIIGHPSFGNSGKPIADILTENSNYKSSGLRNRLIKNGIKQNKCECCGIEDWCGKPITLQLHHINGDHFDNRLENLQILCPNCHSQTHNFCKWNNSKKSAPLEREDVESP